VDFEALLAAAQHKNPTMRHVFAILEALHNSLGLRFRQKFVLSRFELTGSAIRMNKQ